MKTTILKYLSVFIVYFIIDVTYQFVFGIHFSQGIQESAGIKGIYATEIQNPILLLIWFMLMTFALVQLAVNPAIYQRSVQIALKNGFILGVIAYATLGMANGWSINNFPLTLVMEITLEGMIFAPISAGFTTWWIIKKK